MSGETAELTGTALSEKLRDTYSSLRLLVNAGGGSFKSQLKRADKSGAAYAFILGETEVEQQKIVVKPLLSSEEQQTISIKELSDFIEHSIIN